MAKEYPAPTKDDPQVISDFKGSKADILAGKADYISKFGFSQYEQLVLRSQKSYQR